MSDVEPTSIRDYREELVLTLSTARETALESIRKAQHRYKEGYDRRAENYSYCVGDWVLIRLPSEETGQLRKLSCPWRGPYRVTSCNETNVTAVKVYFPREDPIQLRVKPCPRGFTAGYYWYGSKRKGPGHPPRWVRDVLAGQDSSNPHDSLAEQSATVRNSTPASSAFPASDAPVGTAQQLPGLLLEESSDVVPSSNNVDGTKQSTPIPPDSADSEEEEVETDQEQEAAEAPITDTGAADGITEVQADNNMSMSKRQKASALLHLKSLAPVINPLFLAPASLDTL